MRSDFPTHRDAALALLNGVETLTPKEGQFLGGISFVPTLTDKQHRWLSILLDRHGLPPLSDGGAA